MRKPACPCGEICRLRKFEKIGRSAAALTHDLNNLHQVILGCSEMMIENTPVASTSHEYVEDIRVLIKKGKVLSGRMSSMIRGEEQSEMVELDLRDFIRDFIGLQCSTLDGNIALKTELGEKAWKINGDREQIERLFTNLFTNAQDAMPHGGEIIIRTSEIILHEPVSCRGSEMPAGKYVCLSFSDTGHGMEKDVIDHIFEPFYTTKENGSGIGLTGVMDIVRGHGAHIDVSSVPGDGTTFRIYFPKRAM